MLTRRGFGLASSSAVAAATGCSGTLPPGPATATETGGETAVDSDTLIADVIGNPLLEDYGRLLFPITFNPPRPGHTLADVPDLLTWYHHVDDATTVDVVSDLLERRGRGETVFHHIYTEAERAGDPTLADTGLFVFPARRPTPASPTRGADRPTPEGAVPGDRPRVAVCSAGGGFAYVASIHDSMPHALWLSRHGYTAFALHYRSSAQTGCQDLARAISFIHAHAEELGVNPERYSLWGGSAGARLAAYLGSYGPARFGGDDVPGPGTVVMQYTGHSDLSGTEPPTYACVGTADGIASWRTMRARTDAIAAAGVPSELHVYDGLPHGFGLSIGTVAEGWIEDAAAFWQAQIDRP
ncbi:MAG: alpha/beta hydrolase [Actinomyces sp.]|nr:alpha/beta hydrolase [Actinomyces sp.]